MSLSSANIEPEFVTVPHDLKIVRHGAIPSSAFPRLLPLGEVLALYNRCLSLLDEGTSPAIEFVSSVRGEGASTIVTEVALAVCGLLKNRILLIDATGTPSPLSRSLGDDVPASLDTVLLGQAPITDALTTLPDVELHFATLSPGGTNGNRLPSTRSIQTLFSRLRQYYELILVDGGSVQSDNYSPVLARAVDGVVLVVEAERTRMPVVDWSLQLLETSKARLLGTVLNKRRFHIPKRVYELM
jgi:Mrp family chromosome partitioning ATPase